MIGDLSADELSALEEELATDFARLGVDETEASARFGGIGVLIKIQFQQVELSGRPLQNPSILAQTLIDAGADALDGRASWRERV